jgi:hypothetical protein
MVAMIMMYHLHSRVTPQNILPSCLETVPTGHTLLASLHTPSQGDQISDQHVLLIHLEHRKQSDSF